MLSHRWKTGSHGLIQPWPVTLAAAWLIGATAPTLAADATLALADPTRPPNGMASQIGQPNPGPAASAPARPQAAARPAPAASVVAAPPPLLQALHLPRQGAATAIVDDRVVRAGEQLGQYTVVGIDSQGMLLRTATGSERIWLLGTTSKQPAGSVTVRTATRYAPAGLPALTELSPTTDPPAMTAAQASMSNPQQPGSSPKARP